jgi:hypothetical protein
VLGGCFEDDLGIAARRRARSRKREQHGMARELERQRGEQRERLAVHEVRIVDEQDGRAT